MKKDESKRAGGFIPLVLNDKWQTNGELPESEI
jgi:hypothetical protein